MSREPRRRLLNVTMAIGPSRHPTDQVRDAEQFCRTLLNETMRKHGMHLDDRPEDYDDTLQLLITDLWRLNERFDAERNDCFADYARSIIRKRAIDRGPRRLLGKNGSRKHHFLHDELDESHRPDRHLEALPEEPGDEDPDRGAAGGRPGERDRRIAWAAAVLGVRTPQRAA